MRSDRAADENPVCKGHILCGVGCLFRTVV